MAVKHYREQFAWQLAMDFTVFVYQATQSFPREEMFGLTNQLRRAVVSVASNIAEGQGRGTTRDFMNFLRVANASLQEAETQILLAERLKFVTQTLRDELLKLAAEVGRLIYGLIRALNKK